MSSLLPSDLASDGAIPSRVLLDRASKRPPASEIRPVFPMPSELAPPTRSASVRDAVQLGFLLYRRQADGVPGLSHTLPNRHAVSNQTSTGPSRNHPSGSRSTRQCP